MPTHDLLHSVNGVSKIDTNGFVYITERIEVPDLQRNEVIQVDVFNDNVLAQLPPTEEFETAEPSCYQLYLSPYPVQRTEEGIQFEPGFAFADVGPLASDASIIYKETQVTSLGSILSPGAGNYNIYKAQFPNDSISSVYSNIFYSPHLYITLIYWGKPDANFKYSFSVYAKIKTVKANRVECTMGKYQEFLDAQVKRLSKTGIMTASALIAGNTFPSWKFGGIRPELMISGTTALRYFNRVASNANQDMISRGSFQTAYKDSTKMTGFDSAFGDPTIPLPDWIQIMDVAGVTSGAIRPFPPPLKFADNGNTLMF
jgi:hypothetical protein